MSKINEEAKAVETVEVDVEETKESKFKTAMSKVGAGVKKHWKKIAAGAVVAAVGLICYNKGKGSDEDFDDDLGINEGDTVDDSDGSDAIQE